MFDIEKLNVALKNHLYEEASSAFVELMRVIEKNGHVPLSQSVFSSRSVDLKDEELIQHVAQSVHELFVNPEVQINIPGYDALMAWQITLSNLFYLAESPTPESAVESILKQTNGIVSSANVLKLCLLFSTESTQTETLAPILQTNPELFLNVCMSLVWGCSGTAQSCANREWAYAQIPSLFEKLEAPNFPTYKIHGFFMHSSYGFAANKHALKAYLNQQIQRKIASANLQNTPKTQNSYTAQANACMQKSFDAVGCSKKIILVNLEFLNTTHSVYRVLGKSLLALKQNYILVGVAWPGYVHIDDDFFDDFITLSAAGDLYCAQEIMDIAAAYQPVAVYYPALGMSPWAIYHSNMRLAPLQFAAIGHGASSFATEIDYFVIESDIAGDHSTYSEKVIALKPGAMPFYPPIDIHYPRRDNHWADDAVLNIVCSASSMKLNYKLLQICQNVAKKYADSTHQIDFHFFVATYGEGMSAQSYRKLIASYLPDATIHLSKSFQDYVNALSEMHISVSTFPYSGMNTVIDYAMLGIPGIRMQGPQVHEMIEAGMWRRMGMPEWTIVNDEQAYEAALCRLIETPGLRQTLGQQLQHEERWRVFFDGDATQFVDAVDAMIANHTAQLT